ncbi:MAG: hypothetical protein HC794_05080 [Nitrospiraceae bacterium]|nr:hypothetical protein [Nitrospiraceae bacterium]
MVVRLVDGNIAAIKQALDVLDVGRFALSIFPEGNVYLTNDRVTPFLEGAAFIGLKSQSSLLERNIRVLVLPVSIKATHLTNARERIAQRFDPLAKQLGVEADFRGQPIEALHRAGAEALRRNLRQRGIDTPQGDTLAQMIQHAAASVLDRLEFKLQVKPNPATRCLTASVLRGG